jgi:hypothetical protein
MSTESRLRRLGLLHLKDDPAAMEKAMDAMLRELNSEDMHVSQGVTPASGHTDRLVFRLESPVELLLYSNRFEQDEWHMFQNIINQSIPYEINAVFTKDAHIYVECESTENQELVKQTVIFAGNEALERIVKWQKKKDIIMAISLLLVYVLGVSFFVEAYSQTHGLVAFGIMIIAFVLLFIPWWFHSLKSFVEKYLIGKP